MDDTTVLYKPDLHSFEREGISFFLDPQLPRWIATDEKAARLLTWIDGKRDVNDIRRLYTTAYSVTWGQGWRDVAVFVHEALRTGIISTEPIRSQPYLGRSAYLKPTFLRECWIHLLQTCNLSCTHCLVSANPQGARGSDTAFYIRMIDEASDLGVQRFYFTGGEPFLRKDIFDLIQHITEVKKAELIILTNATLLDGERLRNLQSHHHERLKFQVSLDGTSAEVNDAIRGDGVFQKASEGLKALSGLGFETSLAAVVTRANHIDLTRLPALAQELGAKSIHLIWPFRRGEILNADQGNPFPDTADLLTLYRKIKESADTLGVLFDNDHSLIQRVNGQPGVKYDMGNICWESLCLFQDGRVYPSAALAGIPELSLGDAHDQSLRSLWLDSAVAKRFREATVANDPLLAQHPFRFLTGGGDIEHRYCTGRDDGKADIYHDFYLALIRDVMFDIARKKKARWNLKSGFNPPAIYHAMGDDSITCSEDALDWISDHGTQPVRFLHTNCVLSFEVEKPYQIIQNFYGKAAVSPQKELCCPVKYDDNDVGYIPQEVLDRFYGCGSPIALSDVRVGETVLDLGSGAGIDCFIAAKKVGASGKVIGIDMTDPMLQVANEARPVVASRLGIDVVEFRKGHLENIPADDKSVDLVTSNCVINLSPDKNAVFAEIWRILKDNGRMVVADIVSESPVPLALQAHKELWGECISGALSEDAFMSGLEKAGFYGISLLNKTYWKEVEGYPFYSITVRAFKFEKTAGCTFIGQKAIYRGPYKAVIDEEGHLFPRGEAIDICTDTAAKLTAPPYVGVFTIIGGDAQACDTAFVLGNDACMPAGHNVAGSLAAPRGDCC